MTAGQQAAAGICANATRIVLPASISVQGIHASSASGVLQFVAAGDWNEQRNGGALIDSGDWMQPKVPPVAAQYDLYMQTLSGTLGTGTANTWLSMNGTLTFGVSRTVSGTTTYTATLSIRSALSGAVLATCSVTLSAQISS